MVCPLCGLTTRENEEITKLLRTDSNSYFRAYECENNHVTNVSAILKRNGKNSS